MDSRWKGLAILLITCEGLFVACVFVFGPQGVYNTLRCKRNQQELLMEATVLMSTLEQSSQELYVWQTDGFLKEQCARETLGMARPHELIYRYAQQENVETVPG